MIRPRHAAPLLAAAALLAAASCGGGSGAGAPPRPHRLLVVGWDGATFDLVDPLLERGRLPNLAALIAAGRTARLESTRIPISSAAWVGAVTGRGPGDTGVYDFFEREPGSYDLQVIDARRNRCPPLWRILSNRGHRVNVFGVPITWPPEPVDGHLAAGMLAPPSAVWAWPPEYTDELRAQGIVPDVGMWTQRQVLDEGAIFAQLERKERALIELLAQRDWTFSMVVFKSLDVLSHRVYDGRPEGAVGQLLARLDQTLGKLVEAAGPGTNVIVMSDHGFTNYPYAFNVAAWLVEQGYAVEEGRAAMVPFGDRSYADYTRDLEARRLERIDLDRTRVLATETECEGNFGSLRLNLAGREPRGVVPPDGAPALLDELERALLDLRAGERAIVTRVWRGHELYPGPCADAVPDLIFETLPDHEVGARDDVSTFVRHDVPPADHALLGILVAAGPDVAHAARRDTWSILDLAPIALHLLREPAYEEMTGRARPELLREPWPARRVPQAEDPTYRPPDEAWTPAELDPEQRRRQIEALRALGYADGAEDAEPPEEPRR